MDSRLIAGAYSQHYRALEKETLEESDRIDSIARAKRLSQETNKRRKTQAYKRKLEAKREEQRRQEILSKRREEQKKATEKYQRSHIPPSARQYSGRISPRRHGGVALEDALRLIRGSPRNYRPQSSKERIQSPRSENEDPLDRPYFDKPRHHSARPSSGRLVTHHIDESTRAELMDCSMQNLTSSKTLFEQQLEQQQNRLKEQQEQSLREFNNAIQQEIGRNNCDQASEMENNDIVNTGDDDSGKSLSDSCSSLDSLEEEKEKKHKHSRVDCNDRHQTAQSKQRQASAHNGFGSGQDWKLDIQPNTQQSDVEERNKNPPLGQDMTASALYQREASICGVPRTDPESSNMSKGYEKGQQTNQPFIGLTRQDIISDQAEKLTPNTELEGPKFQVPLKQFSTDSLDSMSSSSTISLVKVTPNSGRSAPILGVGSGNKGNSQLMHANGQNSFGELVAGQKCDSSKSMNSVMTPSTSQGQMAWVSPSPQSNTSTLTETPTPTNTNETFPDNFHPRYASAIGLSIWPGQSAQSQTQTNGVSTMLANNSHPYSSRGTLTTATTTTSFPASLPVKQETKLGHYSTATATSNATTKSGIYTTPGYISTNNPNDFASFSKVDLNYPNVHDYHCLGMQSSNTNLKAQPPQATQPVHYPGNQVVPGEDTKIFTDSSRVSHQAPSAKQVSFGISPVSKSPQQHTQDPPLQSQHGIPMGQVPVPAVRTIFPASRPPAPASTKTETSILASANTRPETAKTGTQSKTTVKTTGHILDLVSIKNEESDKRLQGEETVEEETENAVPLKGILKPVPPKSTPNTIGKAGLNKGHPRDSLELARLQSEKKAKKKSVRFADHNLEEYEFDTDEAENAHAKTAGVTSSGPFVYKQTTSRPVSAKVVSSSARPDLTVKATRAASAGSVRPAMSAHTQIRNVQQMTTSQAPSNSPENNDDLGLKHRSNLPSSYALPLNTTVPINRPKAAAHIIMSSEIHPPSKGTSNGYDSNTQPQSPTAGGATAHKSQLEMKVKAINNNFMSRVPVKIPVNTDNSAMVYQVGRGGDGPDDHHTTQEDSGQLVEGQQNFERSKIRDNSSKRVPISNTTVTRTSIVPASTKINFPQSNTAGPSYSSSSSGNAPAAVYDENGMRIDRTPTDEEITWLWDKVRNCLNKDEPGNKSQYGQYTGNGSGDQGSRQTTTLSTKLIDGASLGFGQNGTSGVNGVRTGTGFFYPRTQTANNGPNKVKPAVQQQGSYLRRFGLLKQRRATSATGTGHASNQPTQRAQSAAYARHPTIQPTLTTGQPQQQQQEVVTPMALGYKPQDDVTESTAAFMMAERLAKQSLSDSHIQVAMEDAHLKQEAHNRSRMTLTRGGPSALSIEEQKLLESLDKLNERLKGGTDSKYNGTIHYHQPYQPHLPGFRGHTPVIDSRRTMMASPRSQQRAQSARIRQQTRQYR